MSGNSSGKRGPTLVGSLLGGVAAARKAGAGVDTLVWRRAVGPRIAERTTPGTLRSGTLTVRVASAAWAQELSLLSDEIRRRLAEAGVSVTTIRFRVDRGVAGAPSPTLSRPAVRAPAPLPGDLVDRIGEIDDPELRTAIAQAARYSLALDEERTRASAKPRGARAPRSAGSGNDPQAPACREPTAASKRRRGDRRD